MSSCLTSNEIEALIAEEFSPDARRRADAHLAACERCRAAAAKRKAATRPNGAPASPNQVETHWLGSSRLAVTSGGVLRTPSSLDDGSMLAGAVPSIEGYRIQHEIHRGGQGVVYKATQTATKRTVALKVLLLGPNASAKERLRFEREIDLAASLRHPNIATVYDSGIEHGRYYYAMEYIHGQPLTKYLVDKKLKLNELLRLFQRICSAVSYAHQRGIIHRDLKPGNILVDGNGEPHVVDFGLAKIAGSHADGAPVTLTGEFLGTLAYASPEQTKGDPDLIDVRSDVYSLGVVLYEMLTGQYPYPVAGAMMDVLKAISETQPLPPSSWFKAATSRSGRSAQRVNHEIETIVMKCLRKERERRYQSAGELASDVQRYLAGEPIDAKRDSSWYVLRKLAMRNRRATAVVALLVIIVLSSTSVAGYFYRAAKTERAERSRQTELRVRERGVVTEAVDQVGSPLLRQMTFGWFLAEWQAGRSERARALREAFRRAPDYYAVTAFLLDDTYPEARLKSDVSAAAQTLAAFAIGERHLKAGRPDEARAAFESVSAAADPWFAAAAQARLAQLRERATSNPTTRPGDAP